MSTILSLADLPVRVRGEFECPPWCRETRDHVTVVSHADPFALHQSAPVVVTETPYLAVEVSAFVAWDQETGDLFHEPTTVTVVGGTDLMSPKVATELAAAINAALITTGTLEVAL
jgi:hypothetical protein